MNEDIYTQTQLCAHQCHVGDMSMREDKVVTWLSEQHGCTGHTGAAGMGPPSDVGGAR
jgi:hypothetical protein